MKKILITGTAGFIGFHLAKALLEKGEGVVGLDNINDYYDPKLKYDRLRKTGICVKEIVWDNPITSYIYPQYRFIRMNLEDKDKLFKLFANEQFDYVINLAAQAGVRYSIEKPDVYINSNIIGFFNILEACRNFPIKHLFFASSSSVYGNNSKTPFSEEDRTDSPISLYAATKKSNEIMAYTYSQLYKISCTGFRFFTIYGPWGRPDMALFKFTKAIFENTPIDVYNNGELTRDFTYVDDAIARIVALIDINHHFKDEDNPAVGKVTEISPATYCIMNIGNNTPVNVLDFIETIELKIGKKAKKNFIPMQAGDVNTTFADIAKLNEVMGFLPKTNIKEGVDAFVNWYVNYYY